MTQKYDILTTKFVIDYNRKRKNQLFRYYLCYYLSLLKLFHLFKYLTSPLYEDTNLYSCYTKQTSLSKYSICKKTYLLYFKHFFPSKNISNIYLFITPSVPF